MTKNNKSMQQKHAELVQKYNNGLGKHIDMTDVNEWIDVVGNERGKAVLRRYLNFV